jgi:tripartite-type tricarboxylate transporter receptor subunit TctC
MRPLRRRFLQLAAGAAALAAWVASAQGYPTRPVRFIVSFAAGGPNDIVARVLGQNLSDRLGQQFIVENRAGGGGNVGMQAALASAPDGYTIAFVGPNNAISATLYEKLPFDFIRDSVPVAGTMRLTNVMVVNPAVPANTVAEFIAYAKANPGQINFASGGVGTSPHLSGELLKVMAGEGGRLRAASRPSAILLPPTSWVGGDRSEDGTARDRTAWPQNHRALASRLRRTQTFL